MKKLKRSQNPKRHLRNLIKILRRILVMINIIEELKTDLEKSEKRNALP